MASPDNLISGQKKYDWTRSVNVRKWHWLTTVTMVSQVESWQTTQSATLENVELTSAPLNAAMLDTMSLDHAVRESGVVAGAAIEQRVQQQQTDEQPASSSSKDELSEPAIAACHLLLATHAFEQRAVLFHALNQMRSIQRTMALRAMEYIVPPDINRDGKYTPGGAPPVGWRGAGGPGGLRPPKATGFFDEDEDEGDDDANAKDKSAAGGGGAEPRQSTKDAAAELSYGVFDELIAAELSMSTSPALPHLRGKGGIKPPKVSKRQLLDGGREWFSEGATDPFDSPTIPIPAPPDPTNTLFVRDCTGRRVIHLTAVADLHAMTKLVGRICAHYGNDSAIAAIYGTGRYDNAQLNEKSLQTVEVEGEVSKRLAVATALPTTLRMVSRAFQCEANFQRAKANLLIQLMHAYDCCQSACGPGRGDKIGFAKLLFELGQQMTDIMGARPRLDLSAADFEEDYKASTEELYLYEKLLSRLFGCHVNDQIEVAAVEAAVASDKKLEKEGYHISSEHSTKQALAAADKVRRSVPERRKAARGCARIAVVLREQMAGMAQRTLEYSASLRKKSAGKIYRLPPQAYAKLRSILLIQGLELSQELLKLPPKVEDDSKPVDPSIAAARAALAKQEAYDENDKEVPVPWIESVAIAMACKERALPANGGCSADDYVPPLEGEELLKRPGLLPVLGVWAHVQRVWHECVELRNTLRRAKPRMAWVPYVNLLPSLATTNAQQPVDEGKAAAAKGAAKAGGQRAPVLPGKAKLLEAESTLATAKRFLALVAKEGAKVAHLPSSLGPAKAVLALFEAERHALVLLLTKQRPRNLPPPFEAPEIGGNREDNIIAEAARKGMATLIPEAEEAARRLEELMEHNPPAYIMPQRLQEVYPTDAQKVLLQDAQRQLMEAILKRQREEEEIERHAQLDAYVKMHERGEHQEMEALRRSVYQEELSLHLREKEIREREEQKIEKQMADLRQECSELEAKIEEVKSIDVSEVKRQTMRQTNAGNATTWESAEQGLAALSANLEAQRAENPDPVDDLPAEERLEAKQAALVQEREQHLATLRKILTLRKLKEFAAEQIHQRKLEEVRTAATRQIDEAVAGEKSKLSSELLLPGGTEVALKATKGGLKSVAELEEREMQLVDELRKLEVKNAAMEEKINEAQQTIEEREAVHDDYLGRKVRADLTKRLFPGVDPREFEEDEAQAAQQGAGETGSQSQGETGQSARCAQCEAQSTGRCAQSTGRCAQSGSLSARPQTAPQKASQTGAQSARQSAPHSARQTMPPRSAQLGAPHPPPPSMGKASFAKGQTVLYGRADGTPPVTVSVVAVHPGEADDPEPHYTIRLPDGTERNTVAARLAPNEPKRVFAQAPPSPRAEPRRAVVQAPPRAGGGPASHGAVQISGSELARLIPRPPSGPKSSKRPPSAHRTSS